MSKVQRFEDLSIFQMARKLCKDVYAITKDGEFHKDVRFVQQIQRDTNLSPVTSLSPLNYLALAGKAKLTVNKLTF